MKRPISICSVEGCESPVGRTGGRGFCSKHYKRFRAHGDPVGGGIDYGSANKFVREAAASVDATECINWPYGKNAEGRGRVNIGGNPMNADVAVLTFAKGKKPTPKHECCHSCGNGHLGCVNPSHMYWGTRKENVADAIAHGTSYTLHVPVGEGHHCAKYSDATIDAAMRRLTSGDRRSVVASELGISSSYVYILSSGRSKRAKAWLAANDDGERRAVA